MVFTEIKQKNEKKYYYRVKSIRNKDKVEKKRVYLGANLSKEQLKNAEQEADKKLTPQATEEKDNNQKKTTFSIDKGKKFSEWYTEIVKKAELADIRYNVKGFLVFQPWSVLAMEKMYKFMEKKLQEKNHKPYFFPTLIPESNFLLEKEHVKGFTPEVFWVTHGGETKLTEKLALRPTSETAFYQMFSLWIRSYKDLPFKTYQRANIFRYETKATRPFLRSREFYWIESHCAHKSLEDAELQVKEDMETTKEVLHDIFLLPFIFFERPSWDKFPGAFRTFAADVLNPDGKVVQQPSTHLLNEDFAKAFNVKFKDVDEKEKFCHITCYGPAISRILASVIIVHGDNKGLIFPWKIAPKQIVIVPITLDKQLIAKSKEIKEKLEKENIDVEIDLTDRRPGEKFYFWEMKGVPLRIEIGKRELQEKEFTIYRRDLDKKQKIEESNLIFEIKKISADYDKNLVKEADSLFNNRIQDVSSKQELKNTLEAGKIARCGFCSVDKDGERCAEIIEKEVLASVRGRKLEKEVPKGKISRCIICNKKAKEVVYIARQY
jgi:prolyl-tRNA synthetase